MQGSVLDPNLKMKVPQSATHSQCRTALLTREHQENHLWENFTVQMDAFALIMVGARLC